MKNLITALTALFLFPLFSHAQFAMRPLVNSEGDTVWCSSFGPITACEGDCSKEPHYTFNSSGEIGKDTFWVDIAILHKKMPGGAPVPDYFETYRDTFTLQQVFEHLNSLMKQNGKTRLSDPWWGG